MLTPRHHALLATLAGMTVGVAVFGTILAVSRDEPETPPQVINSQPTSTPSAGDGLQAEALEFTSQTFGSESRPVTAEVPTGWKSSTEGGTRPRFLDPAGVWQVRFDARGSKQSPDALAEARAKSIDEQDLDVISRDNGTLIYTYLDKTRGPRMGLSRWVPTADGRSTAIEITVGGRPKDEAGLRAVLQRATDTLQISGATVRPS